MNDSISLLPLHFKTSKLRHLKHRTQTKFNTTSFFCSLNLSNIPVSAVRDIRTLNGAKRHVVRLQEAAQEAASAGILPSEKQPEMYCDRCLHYMDEDEFDGHGFECADNEDLNVIDCKP